MDYEALPPGRKRIPHPVPSMLAGLLLAAGCGDGGSTTDAASPSPDHGEPAYQCSMYPSTWRMDGAGVTQWWWYFKWGTETTTWSAESLPAVCASYGAGAKLVLEVDYPRKTDVVASEQDCTTDEVVNGTTRSCTIAGAYRFEADCAAGHMLFELPSQNTFHGWYHVEGALVAVTKRSLVGQGVECPRNVFTLGSLPAASAAQDAGTPTLDAGADLACQGVYVEPGCGAQATPVCPQASDVPLVGVYYCGCNGKTLMGSVSGADQPFQSKGCCPGDSGFGPLGSYSCPWDGGLPYYTLTADAGVTMLDSAGPDSAGVGS